jgi:hypothetical protein
MPDQLIDMNVLMISFRRLPKFDPEFAKKQEDADNAGEVTQDTLFFVKACKRIVA